MKHFITSKLVATLDKCKVSDRDAVRILIAAAEVLEHGIGTLVFSKTSIRLCRKQFRSKTAANLMLDFKNKDINQITVHWDGQILPSIIGNAKVDRLPVVITTNGIEHQLGVPDLSAGTGKEQTDAILKLLNEWNLTEKVQALCFDTTATNTGLTMCYQRLSGNTNHNNVDQKPTHLPPGHYIHGHRWNEPYFDMTMPKNITSLVGKSAYLGCRVKHLGNKTVAWIRSRDLHILTVGTYTYTTDQRFQTSYHRDIDEWTLQIKYAQQRDVGVYECQISTQPVRSFSVNLNIVDSLDSEQSDMMQQFYNDDSFIISHDRIYQSGDDEFAGMFGPIQTVAVPTATILGGPDLYVDKGSTINLTCVIKFSTEPPTHIFWYHQDKVLSEETSGGRLKFKTIKAEETKSILLIDDATLSDSGKYSCYPSNTEIASIRVHVLQGERPEAMQTNAAAATKVQSSNPFAAVTLFVATFALWYGLAATYTRTLYYCNDRSRSGNSSSNTINPRANSNNRKSGNGNSNFLCNINSKCDNCSDANDDDNNNKNDDNDNNEDNDDNDNNDVDDDDDDDANNGNNHDDEAAAAEEAADGVMTSDGNECGDKVRRHCAATCNSCGNCGQNQQSIRNKVLDGDNFNTTCIFPSCCNQWHVLR